MPAKISSMIKKPFETDIVVLLFKYWKDSKAWLRLTLLHNCILNEVIREYCRKCYYRNIFSGLLNLIPRMFCMCHVLCVVFGRILCVAQLRAENIASFIAKCDGYVLMDCSLLWRRQSSHIIWMRFSFDNRTGIWF